MINAIYRDKVIASYASQMEAEVVHGDDDEVILEEICDICKTNKTTNHNSICAECYLGINVDLFA